MVDLAKLRALGQEAPKPQFGKLQKTPVRDSQELRRILALPESPPQPELYEPLRELLTKPGAQMRLWDEQCECLIQAMEAEGLFAPIAVGKGKTLISCLLPTVLDRKAVIMTKASLRSQGEQLMEEYAEHFHIRQDISWISYTALSRADSADILERVNPGLIIGDECHTLANKDSARTKRFRRYMRANPDTLFCGLSGTICKRSVRDFAELLKFALGIQRAPLPMIWPVLSEWSDALDVSDNPRPPGALMRLCGPGETAREGWRRRFVSCAGVVASAENEVGSTLLLKAIPMDTNKLPKIQMALKELRRTWETPSGEVLTYAMEIARASRQLRLGGYYRWKWHEDVSEADQVEWMEARRAFHMDVREFLQTKAKDGLDSPLLIKRALEAGELEFFSWEPWRDAQARIPAPVPEWIWISREVVRSLAKRDTTRAKVIFTDIVEVGKEIARMGGYPYYGAGEKAAQGILREKGNRTIVASIQAHGTGRNLQRFSRAVVAGGTPTGTTWEQLLGRLHRSGQTADEVVYELLFPEEAERAQEDARFIEEALGNKQKLLSATWIKE